MDQNLAEFLSIRLRRVAAENILLDKQQVISVIGAEKEEELSLFGIRMKTDMVGKKKKRSAIPPHKRYKTSQYGKYNRKEIIRAIDEARTSSMLLPPGVGAGPEGNPTSNSPRTTTTTDTDSRTRSSRGIAPTTS